MLQMQNSTIAILLQVKENIMLTTLAKQTNKQQLTLFFWKFVSNDYRLEEEQGKENYVEFKSETPIMVGNTTTNC